VTLYPRLRRGFGRLRRGFGRFRKDESGQDLVELVMVTPLLLLFVFGIIEFGSILDSQQAVSYLTREGATSRPAEPRSTRSSPSLFGTASRSTWRTTVGRW
jgi:Flp pilus assembly protein TadG